MEIKTGIKKAKKDVVTFQRVEQHLDVETGQIIKEVTNSTRMVPKEPPHVKIYLDDIASLNSLPASCSRLLYVLITSMGYNNMVPMLKPFKEMLCSKLDMKINTLEHLVSQLNEAGVMHKFGRGLYILDPHLFAKGKWENIEQLRLIIEYDPITGKRKLMSNAPEQLKQLSIKFD